MCWSDEDVLCDGALSRNNNCTDRDIRQCGWSRGERCICLSLDLTQILFKVERPHIIASSMGTLYIYQDTLHTAQEVLGLNKPSRAQFKLHQV